MKTPKYYKGKYECIDEMIQLFGIDAVIGFCKCNVYKYRYRNGQKGADDIEKAEHYMEILMKLQSLKKIEKGEWTCE